MQDKVQGQSWCSQFTSSERSSEASLEEGSREEKRQFSGTLSFELQAPIPTLTGFQPCTAAEQAAGRATPAAELARGGAVLALCDVGLELTLFCTSTIRVLGRHQETQHEGGPAL